EDTHVVATRLNPLLDEKDDLIEGSYRFQVSSPGLDRPLKTESDFKRYKGTRIEVRLYTKIGDNKSFEGILENYDNGDITITDDEGKSLTFEKDNVSIVKRVIVF
ncbi:MAG TPA: ribosome maturation factor RimP, partial [Clostridiales bacterium]|nr:ribosome maturation factor RimP [Clostridiales bacterium]